MVMDTTRSGPQRASPAINWRRRITTPNGVTFPATPRCWTAGESDRDSEPLRSPGDVPDGGQDVRLVSAGPNGVVDINRHGS